MDSTKFSFSSDLILPSYEVGRGLPRRCLMQKHRCAQRECSVEGAPPAHLGHGPLAGPLLPSTVSWLF